MALLPCTLNRAGPLSSDSLDLEVAQHGPDARVVTVVGEIDASTAPDLAAFLTAQLVVVQLVVVDLDGVRFLGSAGLSGLVEVNELAIREDRDLRLVCNSQTANWALDAIGLRERFTFADNVADALKNAYGGLPDRWQPDSHPAGSGDLPGAPGPAGAGAATPRRALLLRD